jgi:peptidoglycan/LPS O-acetylase OafA/YrhL
MEKLLNLPISTNRSDGIDVLRGILAMWVLFSHLLPWSVAVSGCSDIVALPIRLSTMIFQSNGETNPAVIGFIVLSGYCIHRNGFRRQFGSLRAYVIRRFFRIWPVYFLATVTGIACFVASSSINASLSATLTGTNVITLPYIGVKLLGISAIWPSLHQDSFQGNAPLTTAMVEIWLYALYAAAVFLFLRKFAERYFWAVLAFGWTAGIIYTFYHHAYRGWWHNGSFLSFSLYWWIGAEFVSFSFFKTIAGTRKFLVMSWLILTALLLTKITDSLLLVETRKVIFALLFGFLTATLDQLNKRNFAFVVGASLGKASYSLYALHAPLLLLLLLIGVPWWIVIPAVIIASLLINKIYEEKLIRMGKRLTSAANNKALGTHSPKDM